MRIICSLVLLFYVASLCDASCDKSAFMGGKFANCQALNSFYDIYWNVNGEDLNLALNVQTNQNGDSYKNGWVGLGVSVNGGMRGADIAIARMDNGQYVLEDRFVHGEEGMPTLDESQNLQLISATSDDVSTTILYNRKLVACDMEEDVSISTQGSQVIFAWGKGAFGYHNQNRGSATVFFHGEPEARELPDDAVEFDLLMPEYVIPSKDTTYTCTPIVLPADKKYQIVKWRPKITPGNEKLVHHMVIFGCPSAHPINETYECGMAPVSCTSVLVAWSLGQPGTEWLSDFALPFGGDGNIKYVYLQMHYNNPTVVSDVKDQSGVTITYTAQLRKYDIGTLIMSSNMRAINIPPHSTYSQWSECPSECSARLGRNVTLINYLPHMHQIGKSIWLQHIRGNAELPELHRDDHYDFQRQQNYPLNTIMVPGDRLKLNCIWDSSSRSENTTGGESSSQEMCVGVIQYYPAFGERSWSCSDSGVPRASLKCNGNATAIQLPYAEYTALPSPTSTCLSQPITSHGSIIFSTVGLLVVLFAIIF